MAATRTDPTSSDPADATVEAAIAAVARGDLIVIPTDTVYGVGADAFNPAAVTALLAAKGRGRQAPPPVLIAEASELDQLAAHVPTAARALAEAYWPGGLTIIVTARPELTWDLGDTGGTVALRVPDNDVAQAVLRRTGPMAVSSANLTGRPAATSVREARAMLGEKIAVYVDGGASATAGGVASTIVDVTDMARGGSLRIVRHGAISDDAIAAVVGSDLVS